MSKIDMRYLYTDNELWHHKPPLINIIFNLRHECVIFTNLELCLATATHNSK